MGHGNSEKLVGGNRFRGESLDLLSDANESSAILNVKVVNLDVTDAEEREEVEAEGPSAANILCLQRTSPSDHGLLNVRNSMAPEMRSIESRTLCGFHAMWGNPHPSRWTVAEKEAHHRSSKNDGSTKARQGTAPGDRRRS